MALPDRGNGATKRLPKAGITSVGGRGESPPLPPPGEAPQLGELRWAAAAGLRRAPRPPRRSQRNLKAAALSAEIKNRLSVSQQRRPPKPGRAGRGGLPPPPAPPRYPAGQRWWGAAFCRGLLSRWRLLHGCGHPDTQLRCSRSNAVLRQGAGHRCGRLLAAQFEEPSLRFRVFTLLARPPRSPTPPAPEGAGRRDAPMAAVTAVRVATVTSPGATSALHAPGAGRPLSSAGLTS